MATVREVVLEHHKRNDNTWNLKIRLTHNRKTTYIDTPHYVSQKQIRKDFTIKDPFILSVINPVLDEYRMKISKIGAKLEFYTVKRLADYLLKGELQAESINIIEFGWKQVEILNEAGREGSRDNMKAVLYSLQDYFNGSYAPITEIRAKMLREYEKFIRTPRIMMRPNKYKVLTPKQSKGMKDGGVHNHMRDLRILFNDAIEFYNDKDLGITVINHYPFESYKIINPPERKKPKLTIEQVKLIRDCEVLTLDQIKVHKQLLREDADYAAKESNRIYIQKDSREHQAQELAMLSFYLCGMNAVDLYGLPLAEKSILERLDYNRQKTKGRRRDEAFISIHIPDIALQLYIKYAGKLQQRYASHINLDHALSFGMRRLGAKLGITGLQFYDFRHAFADMARNICGFHTEDIGVALNHRDNTNAVTDIYISKNWGIIDKIQKAVIALFIRKVEDGKLCNQSVFSLARFTTVRRVA
ncbi:integrase [Pedobacter sp. AK017]|uniref:phage integrase SAM-like domain-containing protein n=1 Tax=Pedobacter sp. AK017 TaxID=2723073 RepID=UPI00161ED5FF|nr:phage integrase SAM-like domain-containing protein [Pedobacter sp. AK017]MBB5440664.1 integrase [Pedobacter sp. AK017]